MKPTTLTCLAALSLLPSLPLAANPAAPVLGGPEVLKLNWNTRWVTAADLNGDGRMDLAVANNDRGRIDLCLQLPPGKTPRQPRPIGNDRWQPVLEDARFDKDSVSVGSAIYDLAAADLNGDRRVDLVFVGDPGGLVLLFQDAEGGFTRRREFPTSDLIEGGTALKALDVDGDGRADLSLLTQKKLLLYLQTPQGELSGPSVFPVVDDSCFGIDVIDINRDGRADLVYLCHERKDALRVRLQKAPGVFGPEISFRLGGPVTTLAQVRREGGQGSSFAFIRHPSRAVEVFEFAPREPGAPTEGLQPRLYSNRTGAKSASSYALGDYDGDGRIDLAAADPEGAQVYLHLRGADGEPGAGRPYPSLADLRSLASADTDGDGRAELFAVSARDQAVGRSIWDGSRLTYPTPIAMEGRPLAAAAGDLDGDGRPDLAVARDLSGKRSVVILPNAQLAVEAPADAAGRVVVELEGVRSDPLAIRLLPRAGSKVPDMAVTTVADGVKVLRREAGGSWREALPAAGFRRGLLEGASPASLAPATLEGVSGPVLLMAGTGFARVLRINAEGQLEVVDQLNARESNTELQAALSADVDGDGAREVLLVEKRGENLQLLRRSTGGLFSHAGEVPVGRIDLVDTAVLPGSSPSTGEVFLLGRDRFWWIPLGGPSLVLRTLGSHESDLDRVKYDDVLAADLDGDGQDGLICLDLDRNVVEFLSPEGGRAWRSWMHFQVFESDPHFQGEKGSGREPREGLAVDITGDGKQDLILLVHDRLLIYPQL